MRTAFFVLFLSMAALPLCGQAEEVELKTEDEESSEIVSNTFFEIFEGKPGKAAFMGLILPGGGQIYNKRWWKLPLVYGLEGFLVYRIVDNTKNYNRYQEAYLNNLNGIPDPIDNTTSVSIIKKKRDSFRKAREYSYVFFIVGHLITIFEAFIDRHLMKFDVSEDLTFKPIRTDIGQYNGISYVIPLNRKEQIVFKSLF